MDAGTIMPYVQGALSWIRDALAYLAVLLAKVIPFEAGKIQIVLTVLLCLFIASKLIGWIPNLQKSWLAWVIIVGGLFYLVQYF